MSDIPDTNPQTDDKLGLLDLMGGKVAIGLLAFLFFFFLLVDWFFLPQWISFLRSPTLEFKDPCTGLYPGPSGGFALALVAVLGVSLLGLHLFFRRSFLFSAVIAGVVLLGQIVIIHNSYTLKGYLSSSLPGYYNQQSFAQCNNPISGQRLTLREEVYARYKAEEPATGFGGIQQELTVMLQFNLVVGVGIAGLIWISGGLAALVNLISRKKPLPKPATEGPSWLGVPERTLLFQASILTLLAAISGPMFIMLSNNSNSVSNTIYDVIWIAALLFLLDWARWALTTAADAAPAPVQTAQEHIEVTPILQPLAVELAREFAPETKVSLNIQADEERQDFKNFEFPSLKRGTGLTIEETLGRRHFALIANTVNEEILDRGRTVLIICPEEHLSRTEEIFYELLGSGKTPGARPRIWRVGQDRKRPDGIVDVLLTSQFSLETLAANAENYEKELKLLGGTVALNLHETDFGVLDVALDRIKPSIAEDEPLVGIFHSEPRLDMSTRVENFSLMPNNTSRAATTTRFERSIPQWLFVMDCSAVSLLDRRQNLPVGYRVLLSIIGKERRAHPFVYGAPETYSALNWKNISARLLINESQQLLQDIDEVTHTSLLPEKRPHSIAIVDDKGNLADAVAVTTATPDALESIAVVTLGSYPMARFLAAKLKDALKSAGTSKAKREALKTFKDTYGSIAGTPRQGPRELATKVRMTFRAEAKAAAAKSGQAQSLEVLKLSQNKIAAFLAKRHSRALKHLRVNTSRGGLQRLFRLAFRLREDEQVVSVRPADSTQTLEGSGRLRIKNFVLRGPPAADDEAIPALTIRGFENQEHHLPLADHGLTFAVGTRFWIGDRFLTVDSVDLHNREVLCSTRNTEPVHPYHFVRDYALSFEGKGRDSFAVEEYFEEKSTQQPFELITGYVDCAARTYKAVEFGTMRFPFGKGDIRPSTIQTHAESHAQMRSATLLRLVGEANDSAAQRGRRGRGPMEMFKKSSHTTAITGEIAFTLCMTLQDLLASQFPNHARRLSVVCPEASDVAAAPNPGPLDRFVIERLRHLVRLNDRGLPADRSAPAAVSAEVAQAYEKFSAAFSELGRIGQGGNKGPSQAAVISILVIEDSDHDLGVAQSFFDRRDRIFSLWADFLRSCSAKSTSPEDTGYDFGSGQVSKVLDFDGALKVVEALRDSKI